MTERLTSLSAAKQWLSVDTTASDAVIERVIDAASQFALTEMNRRGFAEAEYTENFRGNGGSATLLRNWPVTSILSVGINGKAIGPSSFNPSGLPGTGYFISDPRNSPQSLELVGECFGYQTRCRVVYTAGYLNTHAQTLVNVSGSVTATPPYWVKGKTVTLDGIASAQVTGTPSAGQHSIDGWGVYTFHVSDAGKAAVIEYSQCPMDISFAITETVGEWFKRKDRIGLLSKSLGGQETVSFTRSDLTEISRSTLQNYSNVVPL